MGDPASMISLTTGGLGIGALGKNIWDKLNPDLPDPEKELANDRAGQAVHH